MNSNELSILSEAADIIVDVRPNQNTKFDQYFMNKKSMMLQAEKYFHYLENQKVVFLGDGDGAAAYFQLLSSKNVFKPMQDALLLDFDERIINYHKKVQNDFCQNIPSMSFERYNVLNPLPDERKNKYNFFYINPPYSAANMGGSTIAWLHRCIELCEKACRGCIIVPCDEKFPWSLEAYDNIVKFLESKNFYKLEEAVNIHDYDDAEILSTTLIVESKNSIPSEYEGKSFPEIFTKHLYGKETFKIPAYITDDGSAYGREV